MRWDHFTRWSFSVAPRFKPSANTGDRWAPSRHHRRVERTSACAGGDDCGTTSDTMNIEKMKKASPLPFMIDMRYDRVKGRELYATCDIDPHTPVLRIAPSAALQSIDAVWLLLGRHDDGTASIHHPTELCQKFEVLCQEIVDDVLQKEHMALSFPAFERIVSSTNHRCWADLNSTLYVQTEAWLLALCAAVEFERGAASPYFGYLHGCLPRQPLPASLAGWSLLGEQHFAPLQDYYYGSATDDDNSARKSNAEDVQQKFVAAATENAVWKQRMALYLLNKYATSSRATASSCVEAGERITNDNDMIGNEGTGNAKLVVPLPSPERLIWAFDCVRSRAHPFSFHSKGHIFSPRRYPYSTKVNIETQDHPAMCSLTLCPWFDMINDGPNTNVDFVDAPSSASSSSCIADPISNTSTTDGSVLPSNNFRWKNRDVIIEAGPAGVKKGEALTMCYSASRCSGSRTTASNSKRQKRIDVPETLLKFGFLPSECFTR